jgi:DNA invertase Pin-like site-specific DNA recombinase
MTTGNGDEFTARMFDAINGMMLDMLAAIARKDYQDRRRRQAEGIAKAMADGLYRGRPEDMERNESIAGTWRLLQRHTDCCGLLKGNGGQGSQAHSG